MAHQLDNGQNYTVSSWNTSAYWPIHFFNALAITLVILLLLGASFLAQLPGRTKRFTGLLFGLLVLQAVLGFIPWPAPISALHVFNAFVMLGVAVFVTRENWAFGRPAS
jgi:heme A synthase